MALFSLFGKKEKEDLDKGLEKTKQSVFSKIARAIAGKSTVDDQVLDELEDILIGADVGVETTLRIIERIQKRVSRDKYIHTNERNRILKEEIVSLLEEHHAGLEQGYDFTKGKYP
ncbi:MAG TPA: signal recognition particle-docking protein FtsY, partial [Bacteroidales bacterium]|nr:signal recognition particle-docking protein FtsY [Bacteroidales bacterium]